MKQCYDKQRRSSGSLMLFLVIVLGYSLAVTAAANATGYSPTPDFPTDGLKYTPAVVMQPSVEVTQPKESNLGAPGILVAGAQYPFYNFSIIRKRKDVMCPANTVCTDNVLCPHGTVLIGGGCGDSTSNVDTTVLYSGPINNLEHGRVWECRVENKNAIQKPHQMQAICIEETIPDK